LVKEGVMDIQHPSHLELVVVVVEACAANQPDLEMCPVIAALETPMDLVEYDLQGAVVVNQSGSYTKYPKYLEYEEIHLG
jgi:hypothetical protein